MRDDLGGERGEVHAKAAEVLRFWLEEVPPEQRFAKDAALDATIRERYSALLDRLLHEQARGWRDAPATLLAAVIVLDQFSRNLHRGTPAAFAADPLARALTQHALAEGWNAGMSVAERQFLYMPLMHAEDAALQRESLRLFATLEDPEIDGFARAHAAVIERFGRFPSRNAALGRRSTPEEEAYLSQPGSGW